MRGSPACGIESGMLPRRKLALALVAVVAVACSDSPTAPSPTYPQVGGTYSGPVTLYGLGIQVTLGTVIAVVMQTGTQVTVTTSITGRITRTRLPIRGTINEGGGIPVIAGGPPFRD